MSVYYDGGHVSLHLGDALTVASALVPGSVQTIVTSPPYYGLRDYGHEDQLGAEATLDEYVANMVALFDGVLWLNLGDSYSGRANAGPAYARNHGAFGKPGLVPPRRSSTADAPYKNLLLVPARVALALQADGWILRSDVIWAKPNPMPESVTDRPTKSHEHLFMLTRSPSYYYDSAAIREPDRRTDHPRRVLSGQPSLNPSGGVSAPHRGLRKADGRNGEGKNKRDVWSVGYDPFPGSHFAVYPPELIRPCILATSRPGDVVLDPFSGSGTTGMVATQEGRRYIGIDVNAEYLDLSLRTRFAQPTLDLTGGIS